MDFHARYSAVAKRYRYSVLTRPHAPAIGRNYYYHIPDILDVDAMNDATRYIIGTHDLKLSERGASSKARSVLFMKHIGNKASLPAVL